MLLQWLSMRIGWVESHLEGMERRTVPWYQKRNKSHLLSLLNIKLQVWNWAPDQILLPQLLSVGGWQLTPHFPPELAPLKRMTSPKTIPFSRWSPTGTSQVGCQLGDLTNYLGPGKSDPGRLPGLHIPSWGWLGSSLGLHGIPVTTSTWPHFLHETPGCWSYKHWPANLLPASFILKSASWELHLQQDLPSKLLPFPAFSCATFNSSLSLTPTAYWSEILFTLNHIQNVILAAFPNSDQTLHQLWPVVLQGPLTAPPCFYPCHPSVPLNTVTGVKVSSQIMAHLCSKPTRDFASHSE